LLRITPKTPVFVNPLKKKSAAIKIKESNVLGFILSGAGAEFQELVFINDRDF
jgi:hypothetical protein